MELFFAPFSFSRSNYRYNSRARSIKWNLLNCNSQKKDIGFKAKASESLEITLTSPLMYCEFEVGRTIFMVTVLWTLNKSMILHIILVKKKLLRFRRLKSRGNKTYREGRRDFWNSNKKCLLLVTCFTSIGSVVVEKLI